MPWTRYNADVSERLPESLPPIPKPENSPQEPRPRENNEKADVELKPENLAPEEVQERIRMLVHAIDERKTAELTQLNAVRSNLGLPHADTSVAIAALELSRQKLAALIVDGELGAEKRDIVGHGRDSDLGITAIKVIIPELGDDSAVTPEIREYFNELGLNETMRRFRLLPPNSPQAEKIRESIRTGNLNAIVWQMELASPDFPTAHNTQMRSIADQNAAYYRYQAGTLLKIEELKARVRKRQAP